MISTQLGKIQMMKLIQTLMIQKKRTNLRVKKNLVSDKKENQPEMRTRNQRLKERKLTLKIKLMRIHQKKNKKRKRSLKWCLMMIFNVGFVYSNLKPIVL